MNIRSAKNKGVRLQNLVKDLIYKTFPSLEDGDVKTAMMGESGEDIKLSPAARRLFPFSVECKNTERLNLWDALKQSETNTTKGTTPIVIFKRNRSKVYVTLELEKFMEIVSKT